MHVDGHETNSVEYLTSLGELQAMPAHHAYQQPQGKRASADQPCSQGLGVSGIHGRIKQVLKAYICRVKLELQQTLQRPLSTHPLQRQLLYAKRFGVMTRRSWFLAPRAPNFDCTPTGYLALGSLISDPFEPDCPIVSGLPPPLPDDIHVERASKKHWERVDERRRDGKLGVWAHFLELVQGDVDANWERAEADVFQCETLEINWFSPSSQLIRDRLAIQEVAEYANQGIFQPKIFMITAVMIARNPAMKKSRDGAWGIALNVGADLTPVGAPGLSTGVEHAISHARHAETSAAESSDYIYAYRLSQIMYGRKSVPMSKTYNKGAAFTDDAITDEVKVPMELDNDDAKVLEVVASEHGMETVFVHDDIDEQECECVIV